MISKLSLGIGLAVAAFAGTAALAAEAPAAPGPFSLNGDSGVPDISGLWLGSATGVPGENFAPGRGPADGRPATFWAPWPLPYNDEYQKIYDTRIATAKAGKQLGDNSARCLPFGLPMMLVSKFYPDEIVQLPGKVIFYMNNTVPVTIWTDGREHPKDVTASYNGHSVGYWSGDTLFVDTVAIMGTTSLDVARNPHSDKLHIRWSVQRVAADVLHVHVTLYDEGAFTEPVSTTNIWHRMTDPRWEILDDASCFENNKTSDDSLEEGFKKF